jgi:DNA-directed RNA polymerase subunit A'
MNSLSGPTYFSAFTELAFYVRSEEEVIADSVVHINNKEIMRGDKPAVNGLYDARMGTTDFAWNCETCGCRKTVCPGHFGSVDLKYPVKSPMFRDELLKWLKVICYKCGECITQLKNKVPPNKILGELSKNVKNIKDCPHCGDKILAVSKDNKRPFIFLRQLEDGKKVVTREEYFNHHIERTLSMIRDETVIAMGKPLRSHPRNFVTRVVAAPPNTIRPDIKRIGGTRSSNSDTTNLLKTIVEINEKLPDIIPPDDQITQPERDAYANLDMSYYSMIKGGGGGDIKLLTNTSKPPVAIAERLPKKEGRFRRNLMGKRVSYMIRSVITGDSKLKINEVGVPLQHARNLEIPEVVTIANYDKCMMYYVNGVNRYPGCRRIKKALDGKTYRWDIIHDKYKLAVGDTVMRDMITGDVLCFNRQPSLLFSNIAGMRVVVMTVGETLRINPASCNYFNADKSSRSVKASVKA